MNDQAHDLAFARDVWRLHHLGQAGACETFIRNRLRRYAELDPHVVRAVGGDRMPSAPIYEVRR
jgi:hypothetical protein